MLGKHDIAAHGISLSIFFMQNGSTILNKTSLHELEMSVSVIRRNYLSGIYLNGIVITVKRRIEKMAERKLPVNASENRQHG